MKKTLDVIVSFGAAVVIFGAWAKLLHKSYADTLLTAGLFTEAGIFIMYGIMRFFEEEDKVPGGSGSDEAAEILKRIFRIGVVVGLFFLAGCAAHRDGCYATYGTVGHGSTFKPVKK